MSKISGYMLPGFICDCCANPIIDGVLVYSIKLFVKNPCNSKKRPPRKEFHICGKCFSEEITSYHVGVK